MRALLNTEDSSRADPAICARAISATRSADVCDARAQDALEITRFGDCGVGSDNPSPASSAIGLWHCHSCWSYCSNAHLEESATELRRLGDLAWSSIGSGANTSSAELAMLGLRRLVIHVAV